MSLSKPRYPLHSTDSTQEGLKINDWDVKNKKHSCSSIIEFRKLAMKKRYNIGKPCN